MLQFTNPAAMHLTQAMLSAQFHAPLISSLLRPTLLAQYACQPESYINVSFLILMAVLVEKSAVQAQGGDIRLYTRLCRHTYNNLNFFP